MVLVAVRFRYGGKLKSMHIELLILLLFCHWLADYTHLSQPHMLAAKRFGKPLLPILQHAITHGILMAAIIGFYINGGLLLWLFLFQVITHFTIDTLKGRANVWVPELQDPANPYHWYVFGIDQLLHQLVIVGMWYAIIALPH